MLHICQCVEVRVKLGNLLEGALVECNAGYPLVLRKQEILSIIFILNCGAFQALFILRKPLNWSFEPIMR